MIYRCWLPDYHEEDDAITVDDANDPGYAATRACEHWNSHGQWSGDPMPDEIVVNVRDEAGALRVFDVEPSYSVDFYCRMERKPRGGPA